MSQRLFSYKNSLVSYHRFGEGKEVLVAFHGYNQTGAEYAYFEETLGHYFTIIAIDLFWHGQSRWVEKDDFTDEDMKQVFTGIAQQEDLHAKRFSVCSFSMGARLARALVRNFADRIDHFILLSPPTFSFNSFLNFTTNNTFGLALFRYFVNTPGALQNWVKWLRKLKVLNRSVYVFTSKFVGRAERVEKVFNTWYAQRKLQTNFKTFAGVLDQHHIRVVLIVGENDSITPPQRMISYVKKLKKNSIFILRKKHELATPETRKILEELFGKN